MPLSFLRSLHLQHQAVRQHNNQHNRKGKEKEEEEVREESHGTHPHGLPRNRSWSRTRSSRRNDDLTLSRSQPPFFQDARLIRMLHPRGRVGIDRKDLGAIDAAGALCFLVLEDVGHLFHVLAVEALHFPLFLDEGNLHGGREGWKKM